MTGGSGPFRWTSAARSHVGLVREVNEDACLDQPAAALWAVADGMGGHSLGDMASRKVVEALAAIPAARRLEESSRLAREALQAVNLELRTEALQRDVQAIGSTVVVLLAREERCGCLWAGDSRIYLYRQGRLSQLTRDHSQVQEMLSLGLLSPAEAGHHPLRHLITRAVGAADQLELDEASLEIQDQDIFLLCSDGLTNEVDEAGIRAALAAGDCARAAEVLVDLSLEHGGRDNVSVVVARAEALPGVDKTVLNPIFL